MALKVLMLRKKLSDKQKALEALRAKTETFTTREAEIEAAIAEAETDEERTAVEEEIEKFETEKAEHEEEVKNLEEEIEALEADLEEEERKQDTTPAATPEPGKERTKMPEMVTRGFFRNMTIERRDAIMAQDDVKAYLAEVRSIIKEKRAITGASAIIPPVFMGLVKERIAYYSKLLKYVNLKKIGGEGHTAVEGTVPEAVWTDACGNLNELSLAFYDQEVDCWKVAGYYAVCNSVLEDNDVDLADELLGALAQGIAKAVDKAILYGTDTKMPLGVITRLVQTSEPASYPDDARTWVDLHTSNVKTIAANKTGADLFKELILASGAAKGNYSGQQRVWCMNDTTLTKIQAEALTVNSSGAIVAGVNGTMPIVGGPIETLNWMPDNIIIAGFFDCYLMAERAGAKFATSEHVRFLADQTVFKGTARYDGVPAIAEAFVAIGIANTTPLANAVSFASDTANA